MQRSPLQPFLGTQGRRIPGKSRGVPSLLGAMLTGRALLQPQSKEIPIHGAWHRSNRPQNQGANSRIPWWNCEFNPNPTPLEEQQENPSVLLMEGLGKIVEWAEL